MDFSEYNPTVYALYLRFKDEQPCWPFIGCALILGTIAFFGMLFNSALIYVTFRTKNFEYAGKDIFFLSWNFEWSSNSTLNCPANRLLAFNAALELLHHYVYFTFLYLCLTGQNFIDYSLAVKIGTVAIFGYSGVFPAMLCTGIDRLGCIVFPFSYKTIKQLPYLAIHFIACLAFSAYSVTIIFMNVQSMPNMVVTGFEADLYQGDLAKVRKHIIFVLIVSTILVYCITGIMIYKKRKAVAATSTDETNRQIFISLCLIVSVNIGGYLLMYIYGLFLMPILINNSLLVVAWFGVLLCAIPLNISSISIAPILFVTSSEYRNAFKLEWKRLLSFVGLSSSTNAIFVNSVHPVQP